MLVKESSVYRTNIDGGIGGLFKLVISRVDNGRFELSQLDIDEDQQPWNETPLADYPNADEAMAAMRHVIKTGNLPLRSGVAVRQTRSGEWLVFYASPARNGHGHNTGAQYGRFDSEAEAVQEAEKIAADGQMDTIEFIPCNTNPPGELAPIPWASSMYEHIRRDELPLDEYGRPITGYCRYLVDGTKIYPKRHRIVDAKIPEFFDDSWDRTYYYIDQVDDAMHTVRRHDPGESKILFHSPDLEPARLHLNWLVEQEPSWNWKLEWWK